MKRFIYTMILLPVWCSCGDSTGKKPVAQLKETTLTTTQKDTAPKAPPAPLNTDTVKPVQDTTKPGQVNGQTNFTDFSEFYEQFRAATGLHNMKVLAGYANFPFEEHGGTWTREEFVQSFMLGNDDIRFIKKNMPKKKSSNEYWLNTDKSGLIFKKNKKGYWKWFVIYYAE